MSSYILELYNQGKIPKPVFSLQLCHSDQGTSSITLGDSNTAYMMKNATYSHQSAVSLDGDAWGVDVRGFILNGTNIASGKTVISSTYYGIELDTDSYSSWVNEVQKANSTFICD